MCHDHLTGAASILAQVVVDNKGEVALRQKRAIVGIEIVSGEDVNRSLFLCKGSEYRPVAAADRIDRADRGIVNKRRLHQPFRGAVDTKSL